MSLDFMYCQQRSSSSLAYDAVVTTTTVWVIRVRGNRVRETLDYRYTATSSVRRNSRTLQERIEISSDGHIYHDLCRIPCSHRRTQCQVHF